MRDDSPAFGNADSLITIDLDAITANWQALDARTGAATETAAVVKADAYGLGAARVAPGLAAAGCRTFFVMSLEEAAILRHTLDAAGAEEARIFALSGCHTGQEDAYRAHRVIPVVNSLGQLRRLQDSGAPWQVAIHVDTGMTRLGLDRDELAGLQQMMAVQGESGLGGRGGRGGLGDRGGLGGRGGLGNITPCLLMSHLTAAEDHHDPASTRQLEDFLSLRTLFPDVPASLGNSAGTLLGTDYAFQMTRPGIALYGLHPAGMDAAGAQREEAASLTPAVTWQARILQHRQAQQGDAVGYNGTYVLERDSRIVTLGIGYADGYPRSLGNRAQVDIAGQMAPVVGRVSMDSITVDVTDINADLVNATDHATVLGPNYGLAQMAADAGTIGYEILTQLGQRPARRFKGGQKPEIGA